MSKVQARTTIDNLHIEAHRRYAKDQQELDPRFMVDASSITSHAELAGTSSIYSSQLEQLIQSYIGILSWASFQAPHGYLMQTNRFFRSRLFPQTKKILQHACQEENDQESSQQGNDDESDHPLIDQLERSFAKRKPSASAQVERDKTILVSLLRKIGEIDALLAFISARKLQYQKG
jgi:hypothetical protein